MNKKEVVKKSIQVYLTKEEMKEFEELYTKHIRLKAVEEHTNVPRAFLDLLREYDACKEKKR